MTYQHLLHRMRLFIYTLAVCWCFGCSTTSGVNNLNGSYSLEVKAGSSVPGISADELDRIGQLTVFTIEEDTITMYGDRGRIKRTKDGFEAYLSRHFKSFEYFGLAKKHGDGYILTFRANSDGSIILMKSDGTDGITYTRKLRQ